MKVWILSLLFLCSLGAYAQVGPLPCGSVSSLTTWRNDYPYSVGQVVILNGVTYQSLTNNNQDQNPCTYSGSQWSNVIGNIGALATYTSRGLAPQGIAYVDNAQINGSTDAVQAVNNAWNQLPSGGGTIDARGIGTGTYTVTTQLSALMHTNPVTLLLNSGTVFLINTSFATPSDSPASCAFPVGGISGGSAIIVEGFNSYNGNFKVGPSARLWDVVCNGDFTGNQETFRLDGVRVEGNSSATVMGALMHLAGVFVPTSIDHSGTYQCFAQCLEIDSGTTGTGGPAIGDLTFYADDFADYAINATYPGSVVRMDTLNSSGGLGNINFFGGMIEGNGPHNPLFVMVGHGSVQMSSIGLFGTTLQTTAATPSEYNSNVDPVQLTDVSSFYAANLRVAGNINSTYQTHLVDIAQTTNNAVYQINLNQVVAHTGAFTCLVNNTVEGTCDPGYPTGYGDTALPNYTFGNIVPQVRQTSIAPPSGTCVNGSIWTNSTGTTTSNTTYRCINGAYVAF